MRTIAELHLKRHKFSCFGRATRKGTTAAVKSAMPLASTKAFTLLEIMIVVAIIGLLATLSIPAFAKARKTSITQKCVQNQRTIYDSVIRYEMDSNRTLTSIRNNGVQIRTTLMNNGYMNPQNNFDCPASPIKDYDDYHLVYVNTDITGVRCNIDPSVHIQSN
jgi:prepilin-type N-terminal cleavage/methylation domain-containing protein